MIISLLQRPLVPSSVELHAVAVQDAEDAGAALVATDLPDLVDGVAGVVHVDDGALTVELQS